jgi:hypothetical protein
MKWLGYAIIGRGIAILVREPAAKSGNRWCRESKAHRIISEVQPQVLRLRLSQETRQTSLRMTAFLLSELQTEGTRGEAKDLMRGSVGVASHEERMRERYRH